MHLSFAERFLKCAGVRWPFCYITVLILFLLLALSPFSEGCWGISAPKYGNTSADYDLLVGNTLTVKCILNNNLVKLKRESSEEVFVNSSNLIFTHNSLNISSDQIHIIDDLTAELRIPNAAVENSGFYGCHLLTPGSAQQLVCGTSINVGDRPKPVANFRCINMYNENLTCMWDVENNKVQTDYVLSKSFINEYYTPTKCPKETSKPTSCQWNDVTDPPLNARIEKILNFTVVGTNKLGKITQNFSVNHYEIVLPNKPQRLTIMRITERSITLKWKPPQKLENATRELPLQYQLWVETLVEDPEEKRVIDVGVNTLTYTTVDLIPNLLYNISLRCRSNFSTSENMWSPIISINDRTLPDVPYLVPDTVPEAFELRHYDECRSVTLYWKPIPEKYFNGKDFKYVVQQYQISSQVVEKSISVTSLHATFECLQKNISYIFKLYSSNEHGLSNNSVNFTVAEHKKMPPTVQDVTAISRDAGHYQLSWKFDSNYNFNAVHYKVFWCSSFKPWLLRCDGSIQWSNDSLEDSMTLNLPDDATNFQFAVAVTTEIASSGMHWATCIVPFGKALGKLTSVKIEPKTSTSLKVIWNLDCPAQKAVVNRIEIMYCKAVENQCLEKVRVNVTKSNDSHILHHLEPDSRYCVVIRAYNLKGQASEDSEFFCEKTLEGAPSDSPQNIIVLPKSNATLYVTWQSPLKLNGKVTHYHIYCNNTIVTVNATTGIYEYEFIGLSHYTYYSIRLDACVKHECSPKSEAVTVRTDVGVPGAMESPAVEVNSTFVKISWKRPLEPNGPISFYELRWEQHKKSNVTPADKIFGGKIEKGSSTLLKLNCSETEGESFYTFMIRAVNEKELYGPFSAAAKIKACFISQGTTMLVGLAIGGTFAFTVAVCLLYYLVKWMSEKIHQVKNITVMLPKGLEAPETNPLNNYENFQNGLLQQTAVSKKAEQLSPSADDSDSKNRHGSGSSQYSNSSTDELLYKNGKCTKFERKSSGESSGCSSTSSNTTRMHLSSDSGVESDFPPPSPDVVFIDQNGHSMHKPPLPIVMEAQGLDVQDSEFAEKKEQVVTNKHQRVKDGNLANGIMLKIDQSYSKFGVNGSVCAPPAWMNALAFYSCHLANSEPSVVGIEYESVGKECDKGMPYSKFGLAKSSGSIMEIVNMNPEKGYSKFGMLHNLEGLQHKPNGKTNCTVLCAPDMTLPTVSMLVMAEEPIVHSLNSKEHCSTIQKLVQKPEFLDGRKSQFGSNGFYQRDPILSNGSDYVSLDQVVKTAVPNDISTVGIESQNPVNMETAYTRLGVLSSSIPDHKEYYLSEDPDLGNPGYVSLKEVQSIVRDESDCPLETNEKAVDSFIPLDEYENLEGKEDNCRRCDFTVSLPPSTMVKNGSHYPLPVNGSVCHTSQLSCHSLDLAPTTDHFGTYNKEKVSTDFVSLDYTNTTSPEILGTQDAILQEAKCKNLPLSSEDLPLHGSSSLPFDNNTVIITDYENFPLKSDDVLCATDEAGTNVSDTESLNGYDTDLPPLLDPPYQTPISSTCDSFPHNSIVLKEQSLRTPEADDTLKPEIIYSGSPNENNFCPVAKQNNYIPFGALSSSVNNMCKSVPNALEETKSIVGCLDNDLRTLPLDANLKDHIPHSAHLVPSQNKFSDLPQPTHVSNGCVPRYKVTPTSEIIKNFEPNVKDCRESNSCPEAHRLSKGTKGNGSLDYFVQLVPTVESTICEV